MTLRKSILTVLLTIGFSIQTAHALEAVECRDLFDKPIFKKLTLSNYYLIDDHSGLTPVATGTLYLSLENKDEEIKVVPVNHEKWLAKNPSLQKKQIFEFTKVNDLPLGAIIEFTNPTNSHLTCNCSFHFISDHVPADPIFCHIWNSTEDGIYEVTPPRRSNNPSQAPVKKEAPKRMRNTDIDGKIHK